MALQRGVRGRRGTAWLCRLVSGGFGGQRVGGVMAGWRVTVANGAVLPSGAKPPLQTKDFSSRRNWATPAGPRRRLPCDVPSHPTSHSHCWISTGVRDVSPLPSHLPPGCRAPCRGCGGCLTLRQCWRCTGRTMAGAVPGHVGDIPGWMSPSPEDHGMQREGGVEATCCRLDAWQTEERFQDSPGREPVTASSSVGIRGDPEPCEVSVPSALGWQVPGCVLSCGRSEQGAARPS